MTHHGGGTADNPGRPWLGDSATAGYVVMNTLYLAAARSRPNGPQPDLLRLMSAAVDPTGVGTSGPRIELLAAQEEAILAYSIRSQQAAAGNDRVAKAFLFWLVSTLLVADGALLLYDLARLLTAMLP